MNDVQIILSQLRQRGWTLAAIGDELEVPANTIRKWSAGMHYPANAPAVKAALKQLSKKRALKVHRTDRRTSGQGEPPYPVPSARGIYKHLAPDGGVVDEFLRERRIEAARE
jgi:hypothetical protein